MNRHINNCIYNLIINYGYVKFLDSIGIPFLKEVWVILVSAKFQYLHQVKYPSKLKLGVKLERIGNSSFDLIVCIFDEKAKSPALYSYSKLVYFDHKNRKPLKLPQSMVDYFND